MTEPSAMRIPPPIKWQDFEDLCCDLWAQLLDDKNAIKNGRSGQPQCGVDIYASDKNGKKYGIQCKCTIKLTIKELEEEVEKAKNFMPPIDVFIVATTALKDVNIEQKAREITDSNKLEGYFEVYVLGWSDILKKLDDYTGIFLKYYGNILHNREQDANYSLLDFWRKEVRLDELQIDISTLPFMTHKIRFREVFIFRIGSFLAKIDTRFKYPPECNADDEIKIALDNFRKVAADVLRECCRYENQYDAKLDVYEYWVKEEHIENSLGYAGFGEYLRYRRCVIGSLFYNLILATNHIIGIWKNKFHDCAIQFIFYIERDWLEMPMYTYEPQYDDKQMYAGIESINEFCQHDLSDAVKQVLGSCNGLAE